MGRLSPRYTVACPISGTQCVSKSMMRHQPTRREFLLDVVRAAAIASLVGCASEANPFARLSLAEARAMRAFARQILPSEPGSPGAEEAGVVYFVDRAFGDPYFADVVPLVRVGLARLDERALYVGAWNGFASLSDGEQREIMRAVEHEPFFAAARTLVLIGTFGDPSHGGNRGGVGARIVGMEQKPHYMAPYGWYDAYL